MKLRSLLFYAMLFPGSLVLAQKAVPLYSLKLYMPVSFDASRYQMGTYTWGRWNVGAMEVGLNLKKNRFEQELILQSPTLNQTTQYKESYGSPDKTYYQVALIRTNLGLRYQAGYEIWKGAKEKFRIVPGLGLAVNSHFAKMVSYESGLGFIEAKWQLLFFRPYVHTALHYAFNARWGMDFTLMYSPLDGHFSRVKNFYQSGTVVKSSNWGSSDSPSKLIYSRMGASYRF